MSKLINGRTAEEIKTALGCFIPCGECPYRDCMPTDEGCAPHVAIDALALIERLEAAQPRWRSVEERLPEKEGDYIALIALHQKPTDYTLRQPWFVSRVYYRKKVGFHWHTGKVTHWMPLPEAPKEDAHDA